MKGQMSLTSNFQTILLVFITRLESTLMGLHFKDILLAFSVDIRVGWLQPVMTNALA
jgi:hypothetical protein